MRVRGVYTRCGKVAPDVHHMLFRSQGGAILDELGETYHLINCCRQHHDYVHRRQGAATEAGLVITGQMTSEGYRGPDEYLTSKYGSKL